MGFQDRWYQQAAEQSIHTYFAHNNGNPVVALPTGCHAAGHGVLMFDGSIKAVEHVEVGDQLMGPDSTPRTVLALARGRQEMRRITPTKGESFVVNLDHKLSVKICQQSNSYKFQSESSRIETITIRDYENGTKWYRHIRKLRRKAVEFKEAQQALPARFVGMMLGDGSLAYSSVLFSATESELVNYMQKISNNFGCIMKNRDNRSFVISDPRANCSQPNAIMLQLRKLGLDRTRSSTVFIPECYKIASKVQRLELLAGIIDTDGHRMETGGFEITTISKNFAKDITFVARSLGFAAYCTKGNATLNGVWKSYKWRVTLSGELDNIEPLLEYKKHPKRMQKKDVLCTGFTTEVMPEDNYYGFTLDKDQLYLDENFIVHHNTGKSVVIANFIYNVFMRWPNQCVMILTHRKELISQNSAKLYDLWPQAPIGIFSAGLNKKEAHLPITFGGVQSVYKNKEQFAHKIVHLLLIDECHLLNPKDEGMYADVIRFLKSFNPYLKVIGFSATPFRLKQGYITDTIVDDDGNRTNLFTDIIYDLTTKEGFARLIDEGFLCKLVARHTKTEIDISRVGLAAGEFNHKQLSQAVDNDWINTKVVDEMIWLGQDRWSWLVFGIDIEHCVHLANLFQQRNIAIEAVHSKLSAKQNDARLEAFKRGELKGLVNNDKLTTGMDHPPVDLIGMARHTMSPSLWVQMAGRGTRPYDWNNPYQYIPGFEFTKENCLLLDYAKNCERLGPINNPVIPNRPNNTRRSGPGDMPVKICKHCGVYNFTNARVCDNCGLEFPVNSNLEGQSDEHAVFIETDEEVIERIAIVHASYSRYQKNPQSSPMLRVVYLTDHKKHSRIVENVMVETSASKKHVDNWWKMRHSAPVPPTIDDCLRFSQQLKTPRYLTCVTNQKYPKILSVEF